MNPIVLAILVVVAIGLIAACILSFASKVFFVPVDERFSLLRAELPGANCGGCGFAGWRGRGSRQIDARGHYAERRLEFLSFG